MKINTLRKTKPFALNFANKIPNQVYFQSLLARWALSDRLESKATLLEEPLLPQRQDWDTA